MADDTVVFHVMGIVRLLGRDADRFDGAPLLDSKPCIPRFDPVQTERNGWQDAVGGAEAALRSVRNDRKQKGVQHEYFDRVQP